MTKTNILFLTFFIISSSLNLECFYFEVKTILSKRTDLKTFSINKIIIKLHNYATFCFLKVLYIFTENYFQNNYFIAFAMYDFIKMNILKNI